MWWLSVAALAAPSVATLTAAWERDLPSIASLSVFGLALDDTDLQALADGETLARRVITPEGGFAFGAIVVPASLEQTWVGIQDAEHYPQPNVRVEWLNDSSATRRSYMHLDLPFVLDDRQWITEFTPNEALADATDGRVWQRSWRPGDPATARNPDPAALWIETQGVWTLVDLGDGNTLALFSVRSVLGGVIPDGLSTRIAVSALNDALLGLAARAPGMATHYDAAHVAVARPDGSTLAPFAVAGR